jgi:hypothetical protein
MKTQLNKIAEKYRSITVSESNYCIGGGLSDFKYESRRHENAKNDSSRITLGKANQLFAKATGLTVDEVSNIIKNAVPNMEWHHAGFLPKSYGGGMKKTYFLNSAEIAEIAENFEDFKLKLELKQEADKRDLEQKNNRAQRQLEFLKENATQVTRVETKPNYFHETNQEMQGKFGWFCSYAKTYNLPVYFTGWEFNTKEMLNEFNEI